MRCETPVVVLRLDHYGALGVFRSLGRLGVDVYGVHASEDAPALRSRYCRGHWRWDLDAQPASRSVERLVMIARELGGRPILVPTNDETALFVAAHAGALRAAFRFQGNPLGLVEQLYNKRTMYFLAKQIGIPTARTLFPRSREEVCAFAERASFPVMLKGSDGIRLSRRSGHKMLIVRSAAELVEAYRRLEDPLAPDLMLQEYIPGGEDSVWMFNGYFDARSQCRFAVTGRKLRQTPPYTGMTCLGVVARNDEVERLTIAFMQAIGYRGILDIGWRFDARDGQYKVLDVNPRLGATFRLFVGEDGLDVARALYLDLTGQPIPPSRPREGRKWLVEDLDLLSSAIYMRDRVLAPAAWARSFAGVEEGAWLARDDVRPFVSVGSRFVRRGLRKTGEVLGVVAPPAPPPARRDQVRRHFAQAAKDWHDVYQIERLSPQMIQDRHRLALRWIDALRLPPTARLLDVGCGAGHTALALARRGFAVHALDMTPEMLALAETKAKQAGLRNLRTMVGDVHALALDDGRFDVVVALGLLPWLQAEGRALGEMARVLRPGGYLLATADNAAPLHRLLDPAATPALAPLRKVAKRALGHAPAVVAADVPLAKRHDAAALERLLREAGLVPVRRTTVGFGPFSLFGRPLLPEHADLAVHQKLQQLAERDWPLLRHGGAHHVVLARKMT